MGGGLIQLIARGVQDIYLTDDPQITFFKMIYRRHTNFSVESRIQKFQSLPNFGETATCSISYSGDLVGRIILYVEIPSIPKFIESDNVKVVAWVKNLGYALVQDVSLYIGGKLIDKQYGEFMHIWTQMTCKQKDSLSKMTGNIPKMYEFSNGKPGYALYIPLEFWFCRNTGLYLPLVAMSSSDIKITVSFRKFEECCKIGPGHSIEIEENVCPFIRGDYIVHNGNYGYITGFDFIKKRLYYIKLHKVNSLPHDEHNKIVSVHSPYKFVTATGKESIEHVSLAYKPSFVNSFLYVDYVYLENDERLKYVRIGHEYLIEQVQFNQTLGITGSSVKMNLALKHPCKAFYWVVHSWPAPNDIFSYVNPLKVDEDLMITGVLSINGQTRFGERGPEFFNLVEPYAHHSSGPTKGIYVYSPSMYPENHQPSSTLNMSKIDSANLILKLNGGMRINVYTLSYNILRISFGMTSLAFV